jgi:hypothetical protein
MEQVWERDRGSGGLGGEGLGDVGALVGVARHQRLRGLAAPEAGPLGGDDQLEHQRAIGGVVRPEVPAGEPAILGGQRLVHHEALFVHVQGVGQPPVGCGQARTTAQQRGQRDDQPGQPRALLLRSRRCIRAEAGGTPGRGRPPASARAPRRRRRPPATGRSGAENWLARARARPRCATRREASRSGRPESTMLEFGRRVSYTHGPACPAALPAVTLTPDHPPYRTRHRPPRRGSGAQRLLRRLGTPERLSPAGHRAGLLADARGEPHLGSAR